MLYKVEVILDLEYCLVKIYPIGNFLKNGKYPVTIRERYKFNMVRIKKLNVTTQSISAYTYCKEGEQGRAKEMLIQSLTASLEIYLGTITAMKRNVKKPITKYNYKKR